MPAASSDVNVTEMRTELKERPREVVRWSIKNIASAGRQPGVALESQNFRFSGSSWTLEVFPGGRSPSSSDHVAVMLVRHHVLGRLPGRISAYSTPVHLTSLSISIRNQSNEGASITKSTTEPCTVPGERGVGHDHKARIGWEDFVRWDDLINPTKGFLALGQVWIDVNILPTGRVLAERKDARLHGDPLHVGVRSLFQTKLLSDVTLVADGEDFKAHRAVLASRSKVFEAMFTAPMAESSSERVAVPDVSAEVMKLMLHFVYTDALPVRDVEMQLMGELLQAAHKYEIVRLASLCQHRAIAAVSPETAIDWLVLASMVEASELKAVCMHAVSSNLSEVQATPGWSRFVANKQLFNEVGPLLLEAVSPPAKRLRSELRSEVPGNESEQGDAAGDDRARGPEAAAPHPEPEYAADDEASTTRRLMALFD